MLGSNPSADSGASTDLRGMLRHPSFALGSQHSDRERHNAINPGVRGKSPPAAVASKHHSALRAPSHNASETPRARRWIKPLHEFEGSMCSGYPIYMKS